MKEYTVKEAATLKTFTDNTFPQGSFYFNILLKKKDIRVNGVKVWQDVPVNEGDVVTYYTTPAQEQKPAYHTIFDDDNVLIIDKENGVNSEAVYASLCEIGEYYFIHRLDRNTQGLLVFAKNKRSETELLSAFKHRNIAKIYHAVCVGTLPKEQDILTAYLTKESNGATVRISNKPGKGEKIITEYRAIKKANGLNLVEVTLHTGKTHQIRAHMAYIGCPVLGDGKYGNKEANKRYGLTRQCLIAKKLTLQTDGTLAYLNGKTFHSHFSFDQIFNTKSED